MKAILWFLVFNVAESFSFSLFKEWRNNTRITLNHFITTEAEMYERWLDNDEMINEHNSNKNNTWKMTHNQFSHFSSEEFAKHLLHHILPIKPMLLNAFRDRYFLNESEIREPKKVDWRTKGVVGAVRNQGQCGSCWAFGTVEAVESLYAIDTGNLVNMSVQEIVSCDTRINQGCKGGMPDAAFNFVKNNGLYSDEQYPYTSGDGENGECLAFENQTLALEPGWVKGFKDIPHGREDLLRLAISQQPVTIAADATYFQFYSSGIYESKMCSKETLNHAIVLTGYDMDKGFYWLRNSWGNWGEDGYMRIKMNSNECGLAMSASIPTH